MEHEPQALNHYRPQNESDQKTRTCLGVGSTCKSRQNYGSMSGRSEFSAYFGGPGRFWLSGEEGGPRGPWNLSGPFPCSAAPSGQSDLGSFLNFVKIRVPFRVPFYKGAVLLWGPEKGP